MGKIILKTDFEKILRAWNKNIFILNKNLRYEK